MSALIRLGCVFAYLAMTLAVARWRYQVMRPYTEPISCTTPAWCKSTSHSSWCYRRWGMVDTQGEAVAFALLAGLAWPFIAPAMLLRHAIASGARPLPAEVAAKVGRLEAENERLRREQEGGRS